MGFASSEVLVAVCSSEEERFCRSDSEMHAQLVSPRLYFAVSSYSSNHYATRLLLAFE